MLKEIDAVCDDYEKEIESLRQQLLEHQACIEKMRNALELFYDKWENGTPCYEGEDENDLCCIGNAVKLYEDEENMILRLIPSILNNNTAQTPSLDARIEFADKVQEECALEAIKWRCTESAAASIRSMKGKLP